MRRRCARSSSRNKHHPMRPSTLWDVMSCSSSAFGLFVSPNASKPVPVGVNVASVHILLQCNVNHSHELLLLGLSDCDDSYHITAVYDEAMTVLPCDQNNTADVTYNGSLDTAVGIKLQNIAVVNNHLINWQEYMVIERNRIIMSSAKSSGQVLLKTDTAKFCCWNKYHVLYCVLLTERSVCCFWDHLRGVGAKQQTPATSKRCFQTTERYGDICFNRSRALLSAG